MTKDSSRPKLQIKKDADSTQNKNDVYDLVQSQDLDNMYKKNAQLLSRLSLTGRQNGILQSELCSLIEEKSKLNVKNDFLKTKVDSLKDQISLFARQQKKFNEQSLRLKRELTDLKFNGFKLIEDSEKTNLFKLQNQLASKRLVRYIRYRKRVKKAHESLKAFVQQLEAQMAASPPPSAESQNPKPFQKDQTQEIKTLSENYNNLRSVVSQQEEGFKQSMMSFQKKYTHIQKQLQDSQKELEAKTQEALNFKDQWSHLKNAFDQEKERIKQQANQEAEQKNKYLLEDLKLQKSYCQELEEELDKVKQTKHQDLLKQQDEFLTEIKQLKLQLQNTKHKNEEERERQLGEVQIEHETRVNNLTHSYDQKLQHVRTEMENDILSEKRRYEVFKSMKQKQIQEMDTQLKELQKENHRLKTEQFSLERSQTQATEQLKKEISQNQILKEKTNNLHHLWHDLQQELEQKDQQIQSLQNLNRDLSLSLNKMKSQKEEALPQNSKQKKLDFVSSESSNDKKSTQKSEDKKEVTFKTHHILADIHFD